MLFYKITQDKRSNGTNLWYGKVVHTETIDLDGLAKHMSEHNSPYSRGVIRGVLTDMAGCIKELLLDSKKVKISDLVILSLGVNSTGAMSVDDYNPSENIIKAHVNAQGTGEISKKQLDLDAHFTLAPGLKK